MSYRGSYSGTFCMLLFQMFFGNICFNDTGSTFHTQTADIQAQVVIFRLSPNLIGVILVEFLPVVIGVRKQTFRLPFGNILPIFQVLNTDIAICGEKNTDAVRSILESVIAAASDDNAILLANQISRCSRLRENRGYSPTPFNCPLVSPRIILL